MTNARPPEPTPREALLARECCSASGDDPVRDDGPDPVRPPAKPAIHPFTGKFADPELAAAYRSRAFRMMMPLHIMAMVLMLCTLLFMIVSDASDGGAASEVVASQIANVVCFVLSIGARVAVHRWEDQAKAQRFGATAWTLASVVTITGCITTTGPGCFSIRSGPWIVGTALFAVVNASHGLEFWHTASLVGLWLIDLASERFFCGDLPALSYALFTLLAVHAFCHFQALLNRHAFLESVHLDASRERLKCDIMQLEAGLYRLESRLPAVICEQAGGSAPSETSESTSAATGQGDRSTQSALGAMVGSELPPVPEDSQLGERPSAMRRAGAAQPHATADGHASKPPRRCSWSAETLAAGTSSAPSAASSMGRNAR